MTLKPKNSVSYDTGILKKFLNSILLFQLSPGTGLFLIFYLMDSDIPLGSGSRMSPKIQIYADPELCSWHVIVQLRWNKT